MIDLKWEDIYKQTSNIYEAVAIISKRARQIADDQKIKIDSELTPADEEEINENEENIQELDNTERIEKIKNFNKPVSIALEEMVRGNIEYTYATVEDVDDTDNKE
jgi:DNA-directed RNA polymerase subunit K/omega